MRWLNTRSELKRFRILFLFILLISTPLILNCSEDIADVTSTDNNQNGTSMVCNGYEQDWAVLYGTQEIDEIKGIVVDDSGNVYLSGFFDTASGSDGLLILKYDADGNKLDELIDTAISQIGVRIDTDADGNIYVAYHDNNGDYSTHIVQYNSGLNKQWDQTLDSGSYNESVHDMIIENDYLYVAGTINGNAYDYTGSDYYDVLVGKYNLNNRSWEWQTLLEGSDSDSMLDYGAGIAVDSNYVYAVGTTDGDWGGYSNNSSSKFIAKFDKSTGAEQWSIINDYAGGDKIALDASGYLYVTGHLGVSKFDTNGNLIWTTNVIGEQQEVEEGNAITVNSDGYPIIGGEIGDGNSTNLQTIDAYIGVFDPNDGSPLWSSMYGDPSLDAGNPPMPARDETHAIALGADGSLYVTGNSASITFSSVTNPGGSGNYDVFLMKFVCSE